MAIAISALFEDLCAFPDSAARVLEVVRDPDASMRDLERAVELDATLATKLLKLANSPFYGVNRRVERLIDALSVVGFGQTRNITIALAMRAMNDPTAPRRPELWKHSTQVAACARQLARFVRGVDSGTMFMAGLMHDLGAQLMLMADEAPYLQVLGHFRDGDPRLLRAEKDLFGVNHAALGGAALESWEMPPSLCDAVAKHHIARVLNTGAPNKQLAPASIIALAERIVHARETGLEDEVLAAKAATDPLNKPLGLSAGQIEVACGVFEEEAALLESLIR